MLNFSSFPGSDQIIDQAHIRVNIWRHIINRRNIWVFQHWKIHYRPILIRSLILANRANVSFPITIYWWVLSPACIFKIRHCTNSNNGWSRHKGEIIVATFLAWRIFLRSRTQRHHWYYFPGLNSQASSRIILNASGDTTIWKRTRYYRMSSCVPLMAPSLIARKVSIAVTV